MQRHLDCATIGVLHSVRKQLESGQTYKTPVIRFKFTLTPILSPNSYFRLSWYLFIPF